MRGALLRNLERLEDNNRPVDPACCTQVGLQLEKLVQQGYTLLENAAREFDRRR